jgi:hypothetical protein
VTNNIQQFAILLYVHFKVTLYLRQGVKLLDKMHQNYISQSYYHIKNLSAYIKTWLCSISKFSKSTMLLLTVGERKFKRSGASSSRNAHQCKDADSTTSSLVYCTSIINSCRYYCYMISCLASYRPAQRRGLSLYALPINALNFILGY